MKDEKEEKKKSPILVILLCILMIAAGTIAGIFLAPLLNKNNDKDNYDSNAVDIVKQEENDNTKTFADNITIPCWDSITMHANQLEQTVNFYNPTANKGINFKVTLVLEDGTILYKSDLIPNGKAIYNIVLDSPLNAGEYPAVLDYECFTAEGSQLNGSSMSFVLKMEE